MPTLDIETMKITNKVIEEINRDKEKDYLCESIKTIDNENIQTRI